MRYITPAFILIIIVTAMIKRKEVYSDFIEGAGNGMGLLVDIFPPLAAMLVAAAMLKASGALDIAVRIMAPLTERIGLPAEVMPLVMIRPVSGSGSIGVLSGILNDYGADSFAGRLASVICGSTETTFYCIAVYFSKTKVRHIKKAVPCAVIGDITGIAAALFALRILGL
ncbi:MAG: nucleoside recognition domain-containing protein [Candidatus Ornithomonoglobus sp.]